MRIPRYNKSLHVTLVQEEDRLPARRVAVRAFGCNTLNWYATENALMGKDESSTLVCALDMMPNPLRYGTAQIPASAIGNVVTDPDHQGKGHAGGLMVAAVHHFREKGWHVCPLWPFSFAYYAKYGWAATTPDIVMNLWPDMVRALRVSPDAVRPAAPGDLPSLLECHTVTAQNVNCQTVRDEAGWQDRIDKGALEKCFVLPDENGGLAGYAIYETKGRKQAQGTLVHLKEFHAKSVQAQMVLLSAVAELPGTTAINFLQPADSLLANVFPEQVVFEYRHNLQLRVIDVAKALACLHPAKNARGKVSFEVMDWIINGETPIAVTAEFEGGAVKASDGASSDALRCDINAFTQLHCGALSVAQARALGRVEGGSPEADAACDALLHGRTPFRAKHEPG